MDGVATRTQAAERAILQNDVRLEIELERVIGEDVRRFNQG